ncbi:MAG TPA: CPXCG motif-containing cysteine-rich protein [Bdellovibrionales bacterium]|nr:CPXCG motif-containing cysteine-rich protein [Bdellovibrionales bacterium]
MELEIEQKFRCPYCHERISMLLDLSEDGDQTYIEDCEVCCKPIQLMYEVQNRELVFFEVESAQ